MCYNCDEKKFPGHKCTTHRFLLLLSHNFPEENTMEDYPTTFNDQPTNTPTHIHLSFQALCGAPSTHTFTFDGYIGHLHVTILIDTGSSHNIIQPHLTLHLQLCTVSITPFSVMVGNGNKIQCSSFCPDVPVSIHTYTFPISFYLLPIEGADVVLGMDWLCSLGPLMDDFSKPQLFFTHNGLPITLHDATNMLCSQASFTHFCHMLHINVISLHLFIIDPLPSPSSPH